MKQVLITLLILTTTVITKAQCPTSSDFGNKTNLNKKCPGASQGPSIDPDFTGGPYASVPGTQKQGDLTLVWSSNQNPTPAIQSFYVGTTLAGQGGPASTLTQNGSNYEAEYCMYGGTSIPNNGTVTFFFVDPQQDTALYSCSYTKSNQNLSSLTQPTINTQPVDQQVYSGYSFSFTVAATAANSGSLSYQWRKDGTAISGATGTTYTVNSATGTDAGRYSVVVAESGQGVVLSDEVTLMVDTGYIWRGTTNTSWSTNTNWSGNTVPTGSDDIFIDSVANMPVLSTGTGYCNNITLESGASLTVSGGTLSIGDSVFNNGGTITANTGTIAYNGTNGLQYIDAGLYVGDTIQNLTINNSSGVIMNDTVNITGFVTPTSGTLTTNNMLRLVSNASGSGAIYAGSSGGSYISGDVIVEGYVPGGNRAFRFLTHPFNTAMPLSSLTDDIDITGNGGASNGFTTTQTNNPSAYYFDITTADSSKTGNNKGWNAFTSATSNSWNQYQTMRVLIRGAVGEGLTGQTYTPSETTLDMSGTVNQGDQTITMTRGSNSPFVLSGNPFPCPIQLSNVSVGSGITPNFIVWDANQGQKGGYTSAPFSSNYVLPAFGSFVVNVKPNNFDRDIVIEEADKTTATAVSLFKGTAGNGFNVQVRLYDSSTFWDRVLLTFDDNAMKVEDDMDAIKLYNPSMDFYTMSGDEERLSIDVRPYVEADTFQLGLTAYDRYNEYTFKVPDLDVPQGVKLYFVDKYLNKTELMKQGYEYTFDVTTDTNSQGRDRFAIVTSGKPTNIIEEKVTVEQSHIQLVPNPTISGSVKVSYKDVEGAATLNLISVTGQVIQTRDISNSTGSVLVSVDNLSPGVYIIEVVGSNARFSSKLVKK